MCVDAAGVRVSDRHLGDLAKKPDITVATGTMARNGSELGELSSGGGHIRDEFLCQVAHRELREPSVDILCTMNLPHSSFSAPILSDWSFFC